MLHFVRYQGGKKTCDDHVHYRKRASEIGLAEKEKWNENNLDCTGVLNEAGSARPTGYIQKPKNVQPLQVALPREVNRWRLKTLDNIAEAYTGCYLDNPTH
jgi:hypothetical protein